VTRIAISSCFLLMAVSASPLPAADILYFTSAPFAVGQGATRIITPTQGFTFSAGGPANVPHNDIRFFITSQSEFWFVSFEGFNLMPATVGFYPKASRDNFPASPALDFSGDGRGDNSLFGSFTVLQADFNASGNVQSYAADFVDYDEGLSYAWNYGSIRFNSDIPITLVPEPATATLLLLGILGCGWRQRR
jgi:hypothetical protein